ncbi:MAG: hypothetical protein JXQ90_23675 [Cyclobacteriaceae bacterium]
MVSFFPKVLMLVLKAYLKRSMMGVPIVLYNTKDELIDYLPKTKNPSWTGSVYSDDVNIGVILIQNLVSQFISSSDAPLGILAIGGQEEDHAYTDRIKDLQYLRLLLDNVLLDIEDSKICTVKNFPDDELKISVTLHKCQFRSVQ